MIVDATKARIAAEITRIHTEVMKVPRSFVHVIFLSYGKGCGYSAGLAAPAASLNCILRSGHAIEEKAALLKQLWRMFQECTSVATDLLAISRQEVPASYAMEMGQIMQAVSHD